MSTKDVPPEAAETIKSLRAHRRKVRTIVFMGGGALGDSVRFAQCHQGRTDGPIIEGGVGGAAEEQKKNQEIDREYQRHKVAWERFRVKWLRRIQRYVIPEDMAPITQRMAPLVADMRLWEAIKAGIHDFPPTTRDRVQGVRAMAWWLELDPITRFILVRANREEMIDNRRYRLKKKFENGKNSLN